MVANKQLTASLDSDSFSTNAYVAIIQCNINVVLKLVEIIERSLDSDSFSTNAYVAIIQSNINVVQNLVEIIFAIA
ncbi:MAG: hypothetical protein F6K48_23290 [Okeania sp. SIO3H1]|uniref:hypothetical protein n=1 Tax=Okeania sp. SIO1I7 TaxID=2607772 RepID=UPI0013C57BF5|nr:hypothetical protein [Okeania sp. SIO1I7]NEN91669.1 hypothetical protein [Okeania sp. SIO3H1]NET25388.1 hypothetical protein [Okeania sp. SIO1I7]